MSEQHSAATFIGPIDFSGTTNPGIRVSNLTTAQRDALTPGNGMIIYNSTTTTIQNYKAGSWSDINTVNLTPTLTDLSGTVAGNALSPQINPVGASSASFRTNTTSAIITSGNTQNFTGSIAGLYAEVRHRGTGNIITVNGITINGLNVPDGQTFGTVTNAKGLDITPFFIPSGTPTGTITNAFGGIIHNSSISAGITLGTQIGLDIEALTAGATANIGIRLAKAGTYTLQLSDTGGTAAGGITFGTDTNLYRSTTNTLKTDDALILGGNLKLAIGTATAGTAPLKFIAGINLTTPEDGAIEYDGSHLYGTIGSTRYQLDRQSITAGYTLQVFQQAIATPASSTSYYFASRTGNTPTTNSSFGRIYIPKTGTVTAIYIYIANGGTAGTSETSTFTFWQNNTTATIISSTVTTNSANNAFNATGLSIAVSAGDYFSIKWTTPAWVTPPTSLDINVVVYITP